MDIQQLKYFLDVAQTEHMTRSAKRLNIAQPALSRSVSRLEHELGVSLFDREGRGLQLTDEGRLFQRKLIPLLNELDSICQEIKGVHAENREVRVHLGAASHIAADAVASWMSAAPIVAFLFLKLLREIPSLMWLLIRYFRVFAQRWKSSRSV